MMRAPRGGADVTLGAMQDFPLRIMRLMDHAEREHGTREIVAARADGPRSEPTGNELAHDARRMAEALERLGVRAGRPGRHSGDEPRPPPCRLVRRASARAACCTPLNPRLFDDQLTTSSTTPRTGSCSTTGVRGVGRAPEAAADDYRALHLLRRRLRCLARGRRRRLSLGRGRRARAVRPLLHQRHDRNPKGVLYEHRSTVLHAMSIIAPDIFDLSARSVMLPVVPMFHANSWCIPYAAAIDRVQAGDLRRQSGRTHLPALQ